MKIVRRWFIVTAVLIVAHLILLRWVVATDTAGQLLAPGEHTPVMAIISVAMLLLVRFLLFVCLPSLAIGRLAMAGYAYWNGSVIPGGSDPSGRRG